MTFHLGKLTPDIIIFIPIVSDSLPIDVPPDILDYRSLDISKVEIEYKTIANEHLLFVSDITKMQESYDLISENGSKKRIQTTDQSNTTWIYPASEIKAKMGSGR